MYGEGLQAIRGVVRLSEGQLERVRQTNEVYGVFGEPLYVGDLRFGSLSFTEQMRR